MYYETGMMLQTERQIDIWCPCMHHLRSFQLATIAQSTHRLHTRICNISSVDEQLLLYVDRFTFAETNELTVRKRAGCSIKVGWRVSREGGGWWSFALASLALRFFEQACLCWGQGEVYISTNVQSIVQDCSLKVTPFGPFNMYWYLVSSKCMHIRIPEHL